MNCSPWTSADQSIGRGPSCRDPQVRSAHLSRPSASIDGERVRMPYAGSIKVADESRDRSKIALAVVEGWIKYLADS
jgi:hypothetical protein